MLNFIKNLFGKTNPKKACCGHCHTAPDVEKELHLQATDLDVFKNLDPKIVIGKVLERVDHEDPKMTKVKVTKTDIGNGQTEQILCGGVNLDAGDVVIVATVGAKLSEDFEIGIRKIRGVESRGMICARSELGLSLDGEEKGCIWKLPPSYEAFIGKKCCELVV